MPLILANKEKLIKIVKNAPQKPGVYFWYGKKAEIIYIGRATNLRARLNQYFQKNVEPKTKEMVNLAQTIKYQTTDSLLEAIFLEANYIKKYWPKYNIKDRDDRSFIYLVIPKKEFTRPIIIRGHELKKFPAGKAKIFGPYQSYYLMQNTLKLLRKVFPYGNCQAGNGRACFDYQIGLCPGACINKINAREYQKNINNLILFLNGEKKRLYAKLIKENPDKIKALKHLQEVSLLSKETDLQERKLSRLEGYDISHHAGKESYGAMVVFENGQANPNEYRLFKIKNAKAGDDEGALLEVLLRRFKHVEWPLPELIMIDGGTPQISFLNRHLQAHNYEIPLVGISKYGGDKLVFCSKTKKAQKELAENIKATLLKIREESHRFANRGRKMASKLNNKRINSYSLDK